MLMALFVAVTLMPAQAEAATKKLTLSNCTTKKTMAVGSVFTVKTNIAAKKLTFSSNKKSVATVSSAGLITAKKKGTARITVKYGSSKKKITVTVAKKPTPKCLKRISSAPEK